FNNKPVKIDEPLKYMIEFSSPNTNKPLHLGHIRNNLIGDSLSRILKEVGHDVTKVNLVNDRGIHICKSMLTYKLFGKNTTPEKANVKGDKLVGDFYVLFDQVLKEQVDILLAEGKTKKEAEDTAPLMEQARDLLRLWEDNDEETRLLWKNLNDWVLAGFEDTYKKLGIEFDKTYFESETYLLGREYVLQGVEKGVFQKHEDGSVRVDLSSDGLDEKVLLRSDGTSVYITQDIGTAIDRFENFKLDKHIYVVGNEQIYHFQVLKSILNKLGLKWANDIFHMSYGMVELPEGKMKSREGIVVDADDLIDEMLEIAETMSNEFGRLDDLDDDVKDATINKVALAALKYYILKVDPKKTITFNPKESIDFNGHTGPFIQYSYARISSILRNAQKMNIRFNGKVSGDTKTVGKEIDLLRLIVKYNDIVSEAAKVFDPGIVANYAYELAREFNQYYHEHSILKEKDPNILHFRLLLCECLKNVLQKSMGLLGIDMPEKM
ncbi:MAG: arginine--tRNA ligase, partial [Bacteroidales bacterium]|nr:arginine--tRNA ligase [Bacteroidales bacterium]